MSLNTNTAVSCDLTEKGISSPIEYTTNFLNLYDGEVPESNQQRPVTLYIKTPEGYYSVDTVIEAKSTSNCLLWVIE